MLLQSPALLVPVPCIFLYVQYVPGAHRLLAHKCRSVQAYRHGRKSKDPELAEWQRNYHMNPVNTFSLFDEFMEMSVWRSSGLGMGAGVCRVKSGWLYWTW